LLTLLVGLVTAPPLLDYEEHTMTAPGFVMPTLSTPLSLLASSFLRTSA
jgi:hypothetical protein